MNLGIQHFFKNSSNPVEATFFFASMLLLLFVVLFIALKIEMP